jgi:hypothetical protein
LQPVQSHAILRHMGTPAKDRLSTLRSPIGAALIISPLLLVPAYLHVADWLRLFPNPPDIAALVGIILIGLCGVFLLSAPSFKRIAISVVYAGVVTVLACMVAIGFRGGL